VVKELLQGRASATNIMEELRKMLLDKEYRERMFSSFEDVKSLFTGTRPSMRTAEIVGEMAGWEI
jgi:lipid A disaccharide synthetase